MTLAKLVIRFVSIKQMARLSVNINKIATIRNARGGNNPDVLQVSLDCEKFGADGITVHPRPDERHIRYADVYALKKILTTEFNIEGYPSESFMELVLNVKPAQVTLVPDSPDQITSNHGWDTLANADFLKDIVSRLRKSGIRVSIFVDADPEMVRGAALCGSDRVELYTEPYASKYVENREQAIEPFVKAAKAARDYGLGLNVGHDLSLVNLQYLCASIPWIDECSIGHALVCDALYLGLEQTVKQYKACCHNDSEK